MVKLRIQDNTPKEVSWTIRICRQVSKIRKIIHGQNERFKEEIKTTKNTQTNRNLRAEKYNHWMRNSIESTENRLEHAEESISNLKDRAFEIIQGEEQEKGQKFKKMKKVKM